MGVEPGLQHRRIDGLRHKIIGTGIETFELMILAGMRGEQDDRNLRDVRIVGASDQFADLRTGEFRHLIIEDEQGGSSAYVPPDPKNDKQLNFAFDLLRGVKVNDARPATSPGPSSLEKD